MRRTIPLICGMLILISMTIRAEVPWPERNIWPESPRAQVIRQAMMPSPALLTGAVEFDIPVYTVAVEGLEIPVSLHYRTNGIKPTDDPQPIGYGWVLDPPLRVTRQVLGYPDEFTAWKGDEETDFADNSYMDGYRVVHAPDQIVRKKNNTIHDTMHDLFTVYLPGKVLRLVYKDGSLKGVQCGEYRIENDELLSYIKITDPQGTAYRFATEGEAIEYTGMRTEWLLSDITLRSGTKIEAGWEACKHATQYQRALQPTMVMYDFETYEEQVDDGSFSDFHKYYFTKRLKTLTFPGGVLGFEYDASSASDMLKRITLNSGQTVLREITLSQADNLLTSVEISGEGKWSFSYDPGRFVSYTSLDWWGYHNGKDNGARLSPTVELGMCRTGGYYRGADRSVSVSAMSANLLRKVTYPTGGSSEWEYEVHRFPRQEPEDWEKTYLKNAFSLSEGGGLRVKRITQRESDDDPSPRVRTYTYGEGGDGLGNVPAVPLLSTFITETGLLRCRSFNKEGGGIAHDNFLTVNRFSSYLEGRPGAIPVWYSTVTETEGEGKTEYRFSDICGEDVVDEFWGERYPVYMNTAFSDGPRQVSRTVYKGTPGNYTAVEKEECGYEMCVEPDMEELRGLCVSRNYVYLYNQYSPDFGPIDKELVWTDSGSGQPGKDVNPIEVRRDDYTWFYVKDMYLYPARERLVSRKVTTYHDNGERSISETFSYLGKTSLPHETKTSCSGNTRTVTYDYPGSVTTDIGKAMTAANVLVPIKVTERFGGVTTGYTFEMARWGNVFRPKSISLRRDNVTWSPKTYEWNSMGCLTKLTGKDGVVETWTYDTYGNPLTHTIGGSLRSEASWSHLLGPISLKEPSGVTHGYTYDLSGRLAGVKLNSRKMESHTYSVERGACYVRTSVNNSAATSSSVTRKYDGLGREWGVFTELPTGECIASMTGFDAMGRPSLSWSPVTVSATSGPADVQAEARRLYSDTRPYSKVLYEASPRELEVGSVKAGEAASGSRSRIEHHVNDYGAYVCTNYGVGSDGIIHKGNWPKGALIVETVTDETGHSVETYKDFRGLTICRKEGGTSTYFVYDDYGQLCYILPTSFGNSGKRSDATMQAVSYWYDYDSKGRRVLKKLPGVKAAKMAYDPADRLVAECSAHHPDGKWRLYGYDSFGRQVVAADFIMTASEVSAYAATCHTSVLQAGGAFAGYTMPGAPSGGTTVSASYYDDYNFITVNSLSSSFRFSGTGSAYSFAGTGTVSSGLLTGVYTGRGYEAYYYNKDGQLMESYGTGFNAVRTNYSYTYRGELQKKWWSLPDGTVRSVEWGFDSSGRPSGTIVLMLGSGGAQTKTMLSYDKTGQVWRESATEGIKEISHDVAGRMIRESLKRDGNLRWEERLTYDASGRISSKKGSDISYTYTYDGSGRLKSALTDTGGKDFSVNYTYNSRGNITSIKRKGVVDKAGTSMKFGMLDNLTMGYDGNRLTSLTAVTEALPFDGMTGLGKNRSFTLTYDSSGRLISDPSRGITNIQYDNDGRPTRVRFSDSSEHEYVWDAMGNHLSTVVSYVSDTGRPYTRLSRVYTGDGRVIDNGIEKYARFPGGYLSDGKYYRHVTDYQGNNVGVLNQSGVLEQKTDYYPYGEPLMEPSGQPWLYGGNERLRMEGINEYDFNARRYNSALGSFTTWDPLCEKYPWLSPYSYCGGDPVNHSDSTGLDWVSDDDNNSRYWKWNDDVTSLDEALAAGFSSYLPKGSIIENARIGNGKLGSVYLGYDSSDVSYTHSNKTVTPFQVGVEWLTGKGPRERIFHDGDYFTELLRQHSHYRSAVRQASIAIQNGKVEDSYDYKLDGIGGVGKYLIDYSTLSTLGLTGNLAVTYLGSYSLSWRGERLEDSIVIRITVSNTSTIQSASRPPVIGYWPIWRNTIGSWINNCFQTGYFSPTTQIFYMTENIKL